MTILDQLTSDQQLAAANRVLGLLPGCNIGTALAVVAAVLSGVEDPEPTLTVVELRDELEQLRDDLRTGAIAAERCGMHDHAEEFRRSAYLVDQVLAGGHRDDPLDLADLTPATSPEPDTGTRVAS